MWTEADIKEKLQEVMDPEVGTSIVEMGLVYGVVIEEQNVTVRMTLTSPMCPMGPQMMAAVHAKISQMPMVKAVKVELVWDPPWDPRKMASEDARILMGLE